MISETWYELSFPFDAGQDEVDARKELLTVIVFAKPTCQPAHKRVRLVIKLLPPSGDTFKEVCSIRPAQKTGIRSVLPGNA